MEPMIGLIHPIMLIGHGEPIHLRLTFSFASMLGLLILATDLTISEYLGNM